MRHYETLFIINPELSEDDTQAVIDHFVQLLENQGAFVGLVDNWGRRRLAYEVKKFRKGTYVLFDFGSEPEAVAELERNFKIDDRVIRFLSIKKEEEYDLEVAKAEKAARAEKEAVSSAPPDDDDDHSARADSEQDEDGDFDDDDDDDDDAEDDKE